MPVLQGPKCRLCRAEGVKLFLKGEKCYANCVMTKGKTNGPGMHAKPIFPRSSYAKQLREKQKARRTYGINESQLFNYYTKASKSEESTGTALLRILESRMDNVVYRLGYASSRNQARQFVNHGHFTLNDRRADVPSILVKQGDVVKLRKEFKVQEDTKGKGKKEKIEVPSWLKFDIKNKEGEVMEKPSDEDLDKLNIKSQLIVEFYSR